MIHNVNFISVNVLIQIFGIRVVNFVLEPEKLTKYRAEPTRFINPI